MSNEKKYKLCIKQLNNKIKKHNEEIKSIRANAGAPTANDTMNDKIDFPALAKRLVMIPIGRRVK